MHQPDENGVNSVQQLTKALTELYGLNVAITTRVHAGTATDNFLVKDEQGREWFAKVYREHSTLEQEQAALELALFSRERGLPIPEVHRTSTGAYIGQTAGIALSLWDYVAGAETAESGLTGQRWVNVGLTLGRLHSQLAHHPAGLPTTQPPTGLYDLQHAQHRYDRLIEAYQRLNFLDADQEWALQAALHRRSLLPKAQSILQNLPPLTVQILHGDLASPNLLMRGDEVAAIIDFQPPLPQYLSWEIARIGCDPHTILLGEEWLSGLSELLGAYQQENPAVPEKDLASIISVGCVYTLASTYPLAAPLRNPARNAREKASLMSYGHARHEAALRMLDVLDEVSR